jgi:hypothetical protein
VFFALDGPTPLTAQRISTLLKRVAISAGADPKLFSGGSFRPGGATALWKAGVSPYTIAANGCWHDVRTVVDHYVALELPPKFAEIVLGSEGDHTVEEHNDSQSESSDDVDSDDYTD